MFTRMIRSAEAPRRRAFVMLGLLAAVAVAAWVYLGDHLRLERVSESHRELLSWRDAQGVLAVVLFFGATAAAALVSLPGIAVFTLAGGLLFGWLGGTLLVAAAATLGATGLFLLVRAGLGAGIAQRAGARIAAGEAGRIAAALKTHEIKTLLILRMAPVVPFFVANTLPAAVGVPLHRFAATTFVGILPGTAAISLAGVGLGDMAARGGGAPDAAALAGFAGAAALLVVVGLLAVRVLRA
jgi:uncharacterized membrane protein YdjX (TVP38/TMEM64 family)